MLGTSLNAVLIQSYHIFAVLKYTLFPEIASVSESLLKQIRLAATLPYESIANYFKTHILVLNSNMNLTSYFLS